jgi:hypothetical protein
MTRRRGVTILSRRLAPLLLFGPLVGCGISEGDYLVLRVALEAFTESDSCYFPADAKPPNVANDTNSHLQPQTWVIYLAHGDRLLLDLNGSALEGEATDDGFAFAAHAVDVDYVGADQQEAKITVTHQASVDMKVDGSAVAGDVMSLIRTQCDFLIATPSPGLCEATPDCERRAAFAGVRLDDVDLKTGVDRPNPL